MTKSYFRWFGLLLTIFAILALWSILTKPGVNSRNALRLYPGMPEKETELILGSPGTQHPGGAQDGFYIKFWEEGGVKILVEFSLDDKRMIVGGLHRNFSNHHEEQVPLGQISLGHELSFMEKILVWLDLPAF